MKLNRRSLLGAVLASPLASMLGIKKSVPDKWHVPDLQECQRRIFEAGMFPGVEFDISLLPWLIVSREDKVQLNNMGIH